MAILATSVRQNALVETRADITLGTSPRRGAALSFSPTPLPPVAGCLLSTSEMSEFSLEPLASPPSTPTLESFPPGVAHSSCWCTFLFGVGLPATSAAAAVAIAVTVVVIVSVAGVGAGAGTEGRMMKFVEAEKSIPKLTPIRSARALSTWCTRVHTHRQRCSGWCHPGLRWWA